MPKRAISVTLEIDNLTWLRGRAGAAGLRSVSDLLDRLVADARASGRAGPARSVVGTIDIDSADSSLEKADEVVRGLVDASLRRPMVIKERGPEYGAQRRPRTKAGRGTRRG
jgi:hypothetical protein